MILFVLLVVFVIAWFIIKPYIMSYDTVVSFTGGLGSGKSLISTQTAVKLLKKNRWKVRFYNLRHPRRKDCKTSSLFVYTAPYKSQRVGVSTYP